MATVGTVLHTASDNKQCQRPALHCLLMHNAAVLTCSLAPLIEATYATNKLSMHFVNPKQMQQDTSAWSAMRSPLPLGLPTHLSTPRIP